MTEIVDIIEEISTPLPLDLSRGNTCCFTGHRTVPKPDLPLVEMFLDGVINSLYESGYRYFVCGGALGFDMMAEKAVIRAITEGKSAKLILALPCLDQTKKWHENSEDGLGLLREYQRIKGYAASIRYVSQDYTPTCMRERNEYMVSLSSVCVAYYNGSKKSGSGQTCRIARREGLLVCNLWSMLRANEGCIATEEESAV